MTFEEYLIKKRINKAAFEAEDTARYKSWETMYAQMHQNSFYTAVKMVINDVRLKYHLREEDVPKAIPAVTAPKPVARRATIASSPSEPTTASTGEATPKAVENKPAAFKPRPVVKRPASLQKPSAEGEDTAAESLQEGKAIKAQPAGETEQPAAKARPVIRRPVISKPVSEEPTKSEGDEPELQKPAAQETTAETDKPARPRPVIKRPSALQKPTEGKAAEEQKPSSPAVDQDAATPKSHGEEVPKPAPEEGNKPPMGAEAGASKPARPKPVIKRPAALAKPPAEHEQKPEAAEAAQTPETEGTTPKPPRPRPVIKRPSSSAAAPEPADAAQKEGQEPDSAQQEEKPKSPRPRPVIKRPTKPDESGNATGV